jgi:hypothetical protein
MARTKKRYQYGRRRRKAEEERKKAVMGTACGTLDVFLLVHLSSNVDEFTYPLIVFDAHPIHTLTGAGSASAARRIIIVSPES